MGAVVIAGVFGKIAGGVKGRADGGFAPSAGLAGLGVAAVDEVVGVDGAIDGGRGCFTRQARRLLMADLAVSLAWLSVLLSRFMLSWMRFI